MGTPEFAVSPLKYLLLNQYQASLLPISLDSDLSAMFLHNTIDYSARQSLLVDVPGCQRQDKPFAGRFFWTTQLVLCLVSLRAIEGQREMDALGTDGLERKPKEVDGESLYG